MKKYENGLDIFQGLSRKNGVGSSLRSKIYNNMGFAFMKRGNTERAMAYFNRALALDPGNELAWENRKILQREIFLRSQAQR